MKKANVTVTIQGVCSTPIDELLEALQTTFEELGFQVTVDAPDKLPEAWDGLNEDETVLIKYDVEEE